MLRSYLLLLFFISFSTICSAFEWHRGLIQIDSMGSEIQFAKYGESSTKITAEELPLEFSERADFVTSSSAKLFFRVSTGIIGKWKGPGTFSFERFDHAWVANRLADVANELTSTIFYFNKGLLFITAEARRDKSSIVIETPLGKVISHGGVFSINIEDYDDSSQRNAIINCYQGSLEFEDFKGLTHSLRNGNKMSLILKDDLFKVNTIILDELELRAVDNFNIERTQFVNTDAFPKIEQPTRVNFIESDESMDKDEELKKYYYFPLLKQIKSFNPYKRLPGGDN